MRTYATEKNMAPGTEYGPPKGFPILELPKDAIFYKVDIPTRQTDLLAGYERRYVIPIAMMIAPIFGQDPKPDDVYRLVPDYAKNNLHVVFSRSGVKRNGSVINWDAIVVVVQKLCIVRINCDLEPANDKFSIREMLLWSRNAQTYSPVRDPQGGGIDPKVIPYILEKYAEMENIR